MKTNNLFALRRLAALLFLAMIFPMTNARAGSGWKSGVEGTISIGPAMGGPTHAGANDSKPLPHTTFVVRRDETVIASFTTDDSGHFRVGLPPGHYTIARQTASHGMGFFGPFEIDVTPAKMKTVEWKCDSGIR
jgi:hypothetical protein